MLVWSAKPSMAPGLPGWVIRHRAGGPTAGGAVVTTLLGGVGTGVVDGVFRGAVHETAKTSRTQRDPTGPNACRGITTPAVCTLARNVPATQRTRTTWVAPPNATATSPPRTSGRLARCVHDNGHHRAHTAPVTILARVRLAGRSLADGYRRSGVHPIHTVAARGESHASRALIQFSAHFCPRLKLRLSG